MKSCFDSGCIVRISELMLRRGGPRPLVSTCWFTHFAGRWYFNASWSPHRYHQFFLQKQIPKTWQNSHPIFMAVGYQVTLWYTKNHGQITMFNGKTHNISMAIFQVHSLPEHAAFSCEGSTSFFIAAVLHLVGMLDDLRKHEKTIGFIPGGLPELTSEIQKHTVGGWKKSCTTKRMVESL